MTETSEEWSLLQFKITNMINKILSSDKPISITMGVDDLREFALSVAQETVKALNHVTEEKIVWLSAEQVCSRLSITRATLWRWGKEEYLCGFKFGNRVRYRESDVMRVEAAEKGGAA